MNGFPITLFSFELNDLISQRIKKCLMRDEHDDGMRKLFAKQFNHFTCIDRIQPAGHLIEEQNIGLRNQRAQQRKPLNLTARDQSALSRSFSVRCVRRALERSAAALSSVSSSGALG